MLVFVAFLVVVATWAQVTIPELTGQLVDCYLAPTGTTGFEVTPGSDAVRPGCHFQLLAGAGQNAARLHAEDDHRHVHVWAASTQPKPATIAMTSAEKIAGIGRLILIMILLFTISAVFTGLTFYSMSWSGQHVLKALREHVFRQLHALSLDYYAEHEAGDLMSRITNDAETIQQAISFALVNVLSGLLLLFWIGYNMLHLSVPLGLVSLIVVPAMAVVTLWLSGQARKAFRRTRLEMGNVNAELQESIASVREVQAFNRAEENIENFRLSNAANRDANVRAVAYTSALAPSLEALGYLALAIVACVGGLVLLGSGTLMGTVVSIGLVITFLGYVQRFNQPIQQIAVLWTNIQSAIAGGERMFSLIDETPSIVEKPGAVADAAHPGEGGLRRCMRFVQSRATGARERELYG